MVLLNRAVRSFYRLSVVTLSLICSSLIAILNAKFLTAAISRVHRVIISYPNIDCTFNVAVVTLVNRFLSETGCRMLIFGYGQYSQLTLATAGLSVATREGLDSC